MTDEELRLDQLTGALSILATHEPDREHAARIRARCHARLRRAEGSARVVHTPPRPTWRGALEPAIVGSLCAAYLFEVLSRAVELYRF